MMDKNVGRKAMTQIRFMMIDIRNCGLNPRFVYLGHDVYVAVKFCGGAGFCATPTSTHEIDEYIFGLRVLLVNIDGHIGVSC